MAPFRDSAIIIQSVAFVYTYILLHYFFRKDTHQNSKAKVKSGSAALNMAKK